jgi:hypothetical protein
LPAGGLTATIPRIPRTAFQAFWPAFPE